MKKNFFLFFFLFSIFLYPKNNETEIDSLFPKISEKVDNINQLIPEGWSLFDKSEGDLNKDKLDDIALIIEKNDEKNIITYLVMGKHEETLNFNPRVIIILFQEKDGKYVVASKNTKGFIVNSSSYFTREKIPTEDVLNNYANFFNDPYFGICIKNNTLHISFLCDFYNSENNELREYVFRYQNRHFELIGYEYTHFSYGIYRNICSDNYSTGKRKIETIENEKLKEVKWEKIKNPKMILDDMGPFFDS